VVTVDWAATEAAGSAVAALAVAGSAAVAQEVEGLEEGSVVASGSAGRKLLALLQRRCRRYLRYRSSPSCSQCR
jgi:hypothetical protein